MHRRSVLNKMSLVMSDENTAEDGKAEMVYLREESRDYSSPDLEAVDEHFVDEDDNSEPGSDDGRSRWTRIWQTGAVALFVLSIVSFALVAHAVSIFSSILKICIAGAVYKFQSDLEKMESKCADSLQLGSPRRSCFSHCSSCCISLFFFDTLAYRELHNKLRKQVNTFAAANNALTAHVDQLENEAGSLKETGEKLDSLAIEQGTQAANLVTIVKANRAIIKKQKELIKADTMASIMSTVLRSDRDESWTFDDGEINRLVLFMKGLPAIVVNESILRQKLSADRSLFAVMELLREIEREDIPEAERVLVIDEAESVSLL
jgi:hypothetical protein